MPKVTLELHKHYRIEDIVPHADRMLLLEELITYDYERVVVALTIRESSEFYVPDVGVPAWIGIEYMAQAVAAFSGIEDVQAGRKPQIGLLLGSRRYTCALNAFTLGMPLEISAQLVLRDEGNLVAFHCEIRHHGQRIAGADIKAVRPDDIDALVRAQSVSQHEMIKE